MFWDSSAVVPQLVPEDSSPAVTALLRSDPAVVLWWASPVECQSAIHRRYRDGALPAASLTGALARLQTLVLSVDFIVPSTRVRDRAGRVLAAHPLRAGDALQLAAALVWCEEAPQGDSFVCLDDRLREAARREGFTVLPA
ncbi:MAG TPA: type II toxin-antitoxin system VapC family toxin [Pseudomonadales bacterium]|nr:type II toxin-antitoxin system VapC family toxin [Pseudomonadales bacterium]